MALFIFVAKHLYIAVENSLILNSLCTSLFLFIVMFIKVLGYMEKWMI